MFTPFAFVKTTPTGGGGAVLWNPSYITTLAWYDASNQSSVTLNGSTVSQWNDLSGNSYNATQGDANKQPAYSNTLNGLKVVTFDGNSDGLVLPAINYTDQGYLSIYLVGNRTGKDSQYCVDLVVNKVSTNSVGVLTSFAGGGAGSRWGGYTSQDLQSTATSSVNHQVLSQVINKSIPLISWWVTGNSAGTNGANVYNGSSVFNSGWIGTDQYGSYGIGDIAEIVIIDQTDNTTQRQKMEGYLAWKWGLEGDLPNDHPYKNAAPTV